MWVPGRAERKGKKRIGKRSKGGERKKRREKKRKKVGEMSCHSGLTQNLLAASWAVLDS